MSGQCNVWLLGGLRCFPINSDDINKRSTKLKPGLPCGFIHQQSMQQWFSSTNHQLNTTGHEIGFVTKSSCGILFSTNAIRLGAYRGAFLLKLNNESLL
jgi:hypothetical protein